jgi:hypothetical protein
MQISPGEDHGQTILPAPTQPGINGGSRTAGMQGDHHRIIVCLFIRPVLDDTNRPQGHQILLPAARRPPVAIIGITDEGTDYDDVHEQERAAKPLFYRLAARLPE